MVAWQVAPPHRAVGPNVAVLVPRAVVTVAPLLGVQLRREVELLLMGKVAGAGGTLLSAAVHAHRRAAVRLLALDDVEQPGMEGVRGAYPVALAAVGELVPGGRHARDHVLERCLAVVSVQPQDDVRVHGSAQGEGRGMQDDLVSRAHPENGRPLVTP
jgi:hypothetical protein